MFDGQIVLVWFAIVWAVYHKLCQVVNVQKINLKNTLKNKLDMIISQQEKQVLLLWVHYFAPVSTAFSQFSGSQGLTWNFMLTIISQIRWNYGLLK